MEEEQKLKRQECEAQLAYELEIEAISSCAKDQGTRETELESALESALAESNKLRQQLRDQLKAELELRRQIRELEKQNKDL